VKRVAMGCKSVMAGSGTVSVSPVVVIPDPPAGAVKNPGNGSEPALITMSFTNKHTTITDLTQTTTPLRTKTQAGWGAKKPCDTTPPTRCASTGARKRTTQPGATKSLCRLGAHRNRSVCS